jgi:hypothetical protein
LAAPEYAFAGSLTLQGFDDRARLLRTWKDGILPEKLAEHTTLADPRSPGFLHIALQNRIGRRLDLLLTDLPGEWTKALINRADTAARFEFLKRADGLLVVLDGPALESNEKRHSEVQRHRLLLQRLRDDVGVSTSVPLVLVVSKSDRLTTGETPAAANDLMRWATELGFSPRLVRVAAFSASAERIKSGTGIIDALNAAVESRITRRLFMPQLGHLQGERIFARFRSTWEAHG